MAKLFFKYGCMNSSKTLNLLATAHNYQEKGEKVLLVKSKIDDRFGEQYIQSRAGLKKKADIIIDEKDLTPFEVLLNEKYSCILVDEAQFLDPDVIDYFAHTASIYNLPVVCYGLRTDFRGKLFPGSMRLMELAQSIEEIKTLCLYCNNRASMNMRLINGKPTLDGDTVAIESDDVQYQSVCFFHFTKKTKKC